MFFASPKKILVTFICPLAELSELKLKGNPGSFLVWKLQTVWANKYSKVASINTHY